MGHAGSTFSSAQFTATGLSAPNGEKTWAPCCPCHKLTQTRVSGAFRHTQTPCKWGHSEVPWQGWAIQCRDCVGADQDGAWNWGILEGLWEPCLTALWRSSTNTKRPMEHSLASRAQAQPAWDGGEGAELSLEGLQRAAEGQPWSPGSVRRGCGEPRGPDWLERGITLPRQVQCFAWGCGGAMPLGGPAEWTQAVGAWGESPVPGPSDARQPGNPSAPLQRPLQQLVFLSPPILDLHCVRTSLCGAGEGGEFCFCSFAVNNVRCRQNRVFVPECLVGSLRTGLSQTAHL